MFGPEAHKQVRRVIVDHFEVHSLGNFLADLVGGLGRRGRVVRREQAMRAHLPGCAECRAFYDRWLVVSDLDPAAPSDEDRLARGLGLPVRRAPASGVRLFTVFAGLAAAAAIALFVLRPAAPDGVSGGFVARGAGAGAVAPELAVYRIAGGSPAGAGAPEPIADTIHAGDEVAFAYRNPTGKGRLLVFAVDEHGHVFWYHPGWSDPGDDPRAVAVSTAPGLHELPAAIAQRYDGQQLSFHALFTDQEITVRQVESALASNPAAAGGSKGEMVEMNGWPFPGAIDVVRSVRVMP
jgi:hypothetical protein